MVRKHVPRMSSKQGSKGGFVTVCKRNVHNLVAHLTMERWSCLCAARVYLVILCVFPVLVASPCEPCPASKLSSHGSF